jgi:uncharacterized protein
VAAALERLESELSALGPLLVAFSGGADSALLAYVARRVLGRDAVTCCTAVSPSLARTQLEDCAALAGEWDLNFVGVPTDELARVEYVANGADRCYHCKLELMAILTPLAGALGASVVLGVNLDDLGEHRPGQRAASDAGAVFPFVTAGLSKADVRAVSASLGLRTADKPADACLASRIPHGIPVSIELLGRVGRAEAELRSLGFGQLRVRHHGDVARVELEQHQLALAVELRGEIVQAVQRAGYRYATLDLEGFRSGNLAPTPPGRSAASLQAQPAAPGQPSRHGAAAAAAPVRAPRSGEVR